MQPALVPSPTGRDGEKSGGPSGPLAPAPERGRHHGGFRIELQRQISALLTHRCPASPQGFFYYALDRPRVDIETKFFQNLVGQLTGPNRPASSHLFLDKLQHFALHLVRPLWAPLPGH